MKAIRRLGKCWLCGWIFSLTTFAACADGASRLPNVVIVLADDMGYGDPACYNEQSKIEMPHLDRLAREGMRFTDAHSPAAWCTPSRYGLLTGRYPWRAPRNLNQGMLEPGRMTVATLLQSQGYRTACIGKWHLGFAGSAEQRNFSQPFRGGPLDHGFDMFFGMHASLDIPPYYWIKNDRCVEPPTELVAASASPDVTEIQGAFWRAGLQAPGFRHQEALPMICQRAQEWLRETKEHSPDQPFFLYLPLTAPHTPWLPADEHRGKSQAGDYGDFTHQVDAVLGDILRTLDELAVANDTIVIFSSDNGPVWYPQDVARYAHRSTGPLRGMKVTMWEGGHRVPFVVRWPGNVPAGVTSDALLCFTDLLATMAALVGETLPAGAGEDSINQLPVWRAEAGALASPPRTELVIEGRVLRDGPWKLIRGSAAGGLSRYAKPIDTPPSENPLLFDLASDLGEQANVAALHPDRVRAMLQRLEAIQAAK